MLIISAVRLKCNVVFCTIFYRKRPLLGNFFVNTGLEIRWRNIPAEPLKLRLFSWRNRRPHRLPPSVPEPAAPRASAPSDFVCRSRRNVCGTAAANCRTGTAEAAEFSSRATVAAADFGGAVCNVECMFGMTGYGARPPRSGAALGFDQMVAPIFPPRRTDRNSRPSRGRSGSRPCGSRS